MNMIGFQNRYAPRLLSLLRIVAALIIIEHGSQKLFGFPPNLVNFPHSTLSDIAGVIEVVLGIPLILGIYARQISFILAGEMAVAYFLRHAPRGLFPVNNGGDLAVILCFVFLFLWLAGPGSWKLPFGESAPAL